MDNETDEDLTRAVRRIRQIREQIRAAHTVDELKIALDGLVCWLVEDDQIPDEPM